MGNEELKAEADQLMRLCRLSELLAAYPRWFVGGSYSYDLMCWRDLDVYVLDPQHDLKPCFDVAYELARLLAAKKCHFNDNVGGEPDGLYWGVKLGDERRGAWKLDVWFLGADSYEGHVKYSADMGARLTADAKSAILAIKESYWRRPEYRDAVTSDLIYRAVLDGGVKSVADFESYLTQVASY